MPTSVHSHVHECWALENEEMAIQHLCCWVQSELLRWERERKDRVSVSSVPTHPQEQQKVELLRKAVQAHRAYTDRVSKPCSPSLLSLPAFLSTFLSIPAKNCLRQRQADF